MSAYLIVNIGSDKPEGLSRYLHSVPAFIGKYAGKQILNKGKLIQFDGYKDQNQYLVLEFDSLMNARNFWESDENAPLKSLGNNTDTSISFVEGVRPQVFSNSLFI